MCVSKQHVEMLTHMWTAHLHTVSHVHQYFHVFMCGTLYPHVKICKNVQFTCEDICFTWFWVFSVLFPYLEMCVFTCELHICAHFHMCVSHVRGNLDPHSEMCGSHVKTNISHDCMCSLFCFQMWNLLLHMWVAHLHTVSHMHQHFYMVLCVLFCFHKNVYPHVKICKNVQFTCEDLHFTWFRVFSVLSPYLEMHLFTCELHIVDQNVHIASCVFSFVSTKTVQFTCEDKFCIISFVLCFSTCQTVYLHVRMWANVPFTDEDIHLKSFYVFSVLFPHVDILIHMWKCARLCKHMWTSVSGDLLI